jgi:hypothetical protein
VRNTTCATKQRMAREATNVVCMHAACRISQLCWSQRRCGRGGPSRGAGCGKGCLPHPARQSQCRRRCSGSSSALPQAARTAEHMRCRRLHTQRASAAMCNVGGRQARCTTQRAEKVTRGTLRQNMPPCGMQRTKCSTRRAKLRAHLGGAATCIIYCTTCARSQHAIMVVGGPNRSQSLRAGSCSEARRRE